MNCQKAPFPFSFPKLELPDKKRALLAQLSERLWLESLLAMGRTAPNPPVGCALLATNARGELRVFSGGTERTGMRHAEIVALDRCDSDPGGFRPVHLCVTLEPCSHYGRTAPCVERLLRYP